MSRLIPWFACAALLTPALLTLGSASAYGQAATPPARAERPSRGLFGSWGGAATQSLVANGTLGAGWDNNVVAAVLGAEGASRSDLATNNRGAVVGGTAGLQYSLATNRVSLGAGWSSSAQHYPSLANDIFRRDYGSAGLTVQLPLNISSNASVGYVPFTLRSLYPALAITGNTRMLADDFAASSAHYLSWTAGLSTTRQFTDRLAFNADASYGGRARAMDVGQFRRAGAGAGLSYSLAKDLRLRGGYHYAEAEYQEQGRTLAHHLIDAGVDFSRSLSFSRRTTLSFGTGTSAMTAPGTEERDTRFRLNGNVSLAHEIGRTWAATVAYGRNLQLSEHWPEPVQSDAVSASFGGSISRRLQFSSSVSTTTGQSGVKGGDSGFNAYQAHATLSYALSRYIGASVSYANYYHDFAGTRRLPPGFPESVNRHRVTAEVSVSAPLFQRARR